MTASHLCMDSFTLLLHAPCLCSPPFLSPTSLFFPPWFSFPSFHYTAHYTAQASLKLTVLQPQHLGVQDLQVWTLTPRYFAEELGFSFISIFVIYSSTIWHTHCFNRKRSPASLPFRMVHLRGVRAEKRLGVWCHFSHRRKWVRFPLKELWKGPGKSSALITGDPGLASFSEDLIFLSAQADSLPLCRQTWTLLLLGSNKAPIRFLQM